MLKDRTNFHVLKILREREGNFYPAKFVGAQSPSPSEYQVFKVMIYRR